jgi:hypothetical protein
MGPILYKSLASSQFMNCWQGFDSIIEVKDIHLVRYNLGHIEDDKYAISLGLGDGGESIVIRIYRR